MPPDASSPDRGPADPLRRPPPRDDLSILGALATATAQSQNSGEIAEAALDIMVRATGAAAALILFASGEGYQVGAHRGLDPANVNLIATFRRVGARLTSALEARDDPIVARTEDAPLRPEIMSAIRADGIEHLMLVGLRVAGRVTGVLGFGWPGKPPPGPDTAVVRQAAALIAVSLENARLVKSLGRTLASERRMADVQGTLQSLTLIGETAQEFDELAATTIQQVVEALGAVAGTYALITGDDRIDQAASVGVDAAFIAAAESLPATAMLSVRRLLDGSGPYFEDYVVGAVLPTTLAMAVERGWTTFAMLPITVGERIEGFIALFFDRRPDLSDPGRTLGAISRTAGISLANFRLRERLQASESRYRVLFEHSPDPIMVLAHDSSLVAANRAALDLYRTDLEGLRNHVAEAPPVDEAERLRRLAIVRRDGHGTFEGVGRRIDGSTFPEEVDIAPVEMEGESRWLVLVRDLTDQNRLQQELLQAQKMEAIGQLVSGVAHELNNPLAAIVAFSQLIRADDRLPEDMRRDAELLVQEADRTRRIVQNLLDFARQRPPERHPTQVRPLLESVLALQSYSLAAGRIEVTLDIPDLLPAIEVDRSQLQQVFLNLTLNAIQAIRASQPEGNLWIGARRAGLGGRSVRLSVSDNGPGVPDEIRSRLFLPFSTTKAPGQGTGLGLSVSFGIVSGHGGTLRYEPRSGGGSTFVVELPVAAQPATDGRSMPDVAAPTRERPATVQGRVLVVDDEPSIRAFLTKALRLIGLETIAASEGQEAVARCREEQFDAVLVDHRMPGMSGTEVFRAIVAARPELARRFIFMSGDVLNPELQAFAREKRVGLLAKPFDVETVRSVVRDIVEGVRAGTTMDQPEGSRG